MIVQIDSAGQSGRMWAIKPASLLTVCSVAKSTGKGPGSIVEPGYAAMAIRFWQNLSVLNEGVAHPLTLTVTRFRPKDAKPERSKLQPA